MTALTLLLVTTIIFFLQKFLGSLSGWFIGFLLTFTNDAKRLSTLKKQRYDTNVEKNSVSPQDQYAKWTKLNRKLDSLTKDIDSLEVLLSSKQGQYGSLVSSLTRALVFLSYGMKFWYRKEKLFLMPDVFPIPVVSWLWSNGVSMGIWMFVLGRVIGGLEFIYGELLSTK
jgi:hypothetical protein